MPDLRLRAQTRIPYAQAVLELTRYARETTADFAFGPLRVAALEERGLTVSGDQVTLAAIADLLSLKVPGLVAVEELWSDNGSLTVC